MTLVPVDPKNETSVVLLLERVHQWLATAVERSDVSEIAAVKAQIATAAEATKQLNLSKEIQLDAQEMVRRAEYALGKAIRKGQAEGTVARRGDIGSGSGLRNGGTRSTEPGQLVRARDLFANNDEWTDTYRIAEAEPEQFEAALDDAKSEHNLTRANVVRKVQGQTGATGHKSRAAKADLLEELAAQGFTSRQMCKALGLSRDDQVRALAREFGIEIPADRTVLGTRRIDSDRVVENTATALEGLAMGIESIDLAGVDSAIASQWADSLTDSMRVLNRFVRQIKEKTQ